MRILLLTHRLPYAPNRGDRIRAYHLLRVLAARHEVHLASLVHDGHEREKIATLRPLVASVRGAMVPPRRRLVSAALAMTKSQPLTHALLHSRAMRPLLEEIVERAKPEIVVAYCTGMARYALEPPLDSVPCLLDMVDVDSQKWSALARTRGAKRWLYMREARLMREFEQRAVRHAFATTVVSEREKELLEVVVPEADPLVVQNGIDIASFSSPDPPASGLQVVFCGVFNYPPNEAGALWFASHVWPRVLQEEPEARLTLVGMNPSRAVRALGRDTSVTVTGTVPDVRPYLWSAALAVAPLHLARGVQNKVLEAIAAGLPCVVTPQVFEGLPHNAARACVSAADPESFARAVLGLLRRAPAERRVLTDNADLRVLSWESQLQPMLRLLDAAPRRATPIKQISSSSSGGTNHARVSGWTGR